jgi:hypothetical protein
MTGTAEVLILAPEPDKPVVQGGASCEFELV